MKHSGGGLLHRVLLRGCIVTRSSLDVLLEEASPAFVPGACSHGLSLMVTNLSLTFSETMSEQTVSWHGPTMGRRSFTWSGIPSTVRFRALVIPVTRPTLYFVVHQPRGVFTYTPVIRFEDSLLLIVCRHPCSIDSFQPYAVPIDHIGWCCSRGHVILWRDVVTVYCFRYITPFSGGDPFYSSVTLLDDAVTRGDVCTVELKSDSPLI